MEAERRRTERLFLALLIASCAFIAALVFGGGVTGNDFWWHVKTGEWIAANGAVPRTDVFSWHGAELPWTTHEWLSELLLFWLFSVAGQTGVYVFCVAAVTALTAWTCWEHRAQILHSAPACAVLICMFTASLTTLTSGRPHIFTFFLLFAELKCLYAAIQNSRTRAVYWIPVIACLWSNMHAGSAVLSYLLCGVFAVAVSVRPPLKRLDTAVKTRYLTRKMFLVAALTLGATLVNPNGIRAFVYPFVNAADAFMLTAISEWTVPDPKIPAQLILLFLPLAAVILVLFVTDKKLRPADIAVTGMFTFLFLCSIRFSALWFIAVTYAAIRYFPVMRLKPARKAARIAVASVTALVVAATGYTIADTIISSGSELIDRELSNEMVAAVKDAQAERLFNDYDYGGELIFEGIPVFFDGRADVYSGAIMNEGVRLMLLTGTDAYGGIGALFEKYGFDYVIIRAERPLCAHMLSSPDKYAVVAEDGGAVLFKVNIY